ncbi:putative integral membrane sensor protein (plasmid) [Xylanimonas cellulosilytica DSM 15894]|uniref:Integral membrane sensor protein n=1 Tax=Xylanimonas cellulosilytica (strain DSM 15894 / JCM 12276 / CECT 5975 / KCTC 9989 / LMG 20990 / NBRC 107835 / XIL07) TaxID=446471 RepID=D1C0X3_XYLCX|nr:integral membrane sensor protein [Xylanimonas cellulosilytica]ACZ32439.1 putative integral membrane sensor protein [Xylanimonas cellulosilytica DSM 15894]
MSAAWTPRRRLLARILTVLGPVIALPIILAGPAAAAPGDDDLVKLGQTPPGLAWIHLNDSRGIPLWNFEMSLDRGGITDPGKFFWSQITDGSWVLYRSFCALALWFIDWVMSFTWINTIAAPLLAVGDAMRSVLQSIGLAPTLLALTGLMAMLWMIKGRSTTAVYEIAIACIIGALALGVFADPVRMVAGPDGFIVNAAQTGQQLAAELSTGNAEGQSAEQLQAAQTGQLVDTFIRQPTEMVNFGRVLDGTKCESAYNDVLRDGPYGNESDIRDAVDDCDSNLGDYAANPSSGMALGSLVFMPASFVVLLLGGAIGFAVITAAVRAMYQSLKSIVTFITGMLPGGGRGSLMLTAAEVLVSMLIVVFTSIFMSIFMLIIQALFASDANDSVAQAFVITDIVIVAGIVVFTRQHKQIKALSGRIATWMAQRPGAGPTRMPDRQPGMGLPGAASVVSAATNLARFRQGRAAAAGAGLGAGTFIDGRQVIFNGAGAGAPGPINVGPIRAGTVPGAGGRRANAATVPAVAGTTARGQLPPGGDGRGLPPGPDTPPGLPPGKGTPALPPGRPGAAQLPAGPSAGRLRLEAATKKTGRKTLGVLARAGTHAVLAYVTGGASTVATGAAKVAGAMRTARRAALVARMAGGAARGSSSRVASPTRVRAVPATPPASGRAQRFRGAPARPATPPPGGGKGTTIPAGKVVRPAGKTPGVTVMRPGDAGYLTPAERLAAVQGRHRAGGGDRAPRG